MNKLLQFVYVEDVIPAKWLEAHKTEYDADFGLVPVSVKQALKMWREEQEGGGHKMFAIGLILIVTIWLLSKFFD